MDKTAASRMQAGPRLKGHTIIVPSEQYNQDAARFWETHGFHWREWPRCTWERDTRQPSGGKIYTPHAWLTATREEYFQFWPSLKARPQTDCRKCGEMFAPQRDGQTTCPECQTAQQIYTKTWR